MKEKTLTFFEETTFEAMDFAGKIKASGIELSESLKNHFELLDDEKAEEETEAKKADLGEDLFEFLVYTDKDEV